MTVHEQTLKGKFDSLKQRCLVEHTNHDDMYEKVILTQERRAMGWCRDRGTDNMICMGLKKRGVTLDIDDAMQLQVYMVRVCSCCLA